MKHIIVGTAGHIDHGKSALVKALTGTDPDRLEEEKRRGITIDIGFAHLDLPAAGDSPALRLGFVDVPGHERFVRNMLAGVGGIDLVLLVIAADESIKPQTREHFDICRLLGIPRGLTVLTKADLVEPDGMELVRLEAEEFLKGSFLAGAPIVPVSSKTGAGLDKLIDAIRSVAATVPGKDASHYFRLPVDRAFLMKGFGTVVTGTLVSGRVGKDEEVELLPARRRLRVRGIQVHGQPADEAAAGQRTALNLAGVEPGDLARGMTLAAPGRFHPTTHVDAHLSLLPSARPLKQRARVHFHQGTAETVAEVRFLADDALAPGRAAYAQFRLRVPILLLPGDRFIVRQFSPVTTIGGGVVLDPQPLKHKAGDEEAARFLDILARGQHDEILEALANAGPQPVLEEHRLLARTGWRASELRAAAETLAATGKLRLLRHTPLLAASAGRWDSLEKQMVGTVREFHQREPLREGISKEELKARVTGRAPEALFSALLKHLVEARALEVAGESVKQAGRAVTLSAEEAEARAAIEQAFRHAGLAVPAVKEVLAGLRVEPARARRIIEILLREKALEKVTEDLLFHREALARLPELLRAYKREKGERLSVPAFKELAGVTRKYAIPLLEHLDRQRLTRRAGDYRLILL